MLDRLPVFPLDSIFERPRRPPTNRDALDLGSTTAPADTDYEAFVMEGERMQRLPVDCAQE